VAADPELTDGEGDAPEGFGFREVDAFLGDLVSARALKTAFELQLVDLLLERGTQSRSALGEALGIDAAGLEILLGLLEGAGVLAGESGQGGRVALAEAFRKALAHRDLLQARLDFAGFVTADFMELFSELVTAPDRFQEHARLFRLFDYGRAAQTSPESQRHTRIWVDFTTVLSRYEAKACLHHYDFSGHRKLLDVGGNSGEFALQLCRASPQLRAVVFDLPGVCEIGKQHVLVHDERDRIRFRPGNALEDDWPTGFDLVCWKSMLHDWPDAQARALLARAATSLEPEGRVLIFERAPLPLREGPVPFALLPTLLFARSYRPASWYVAELETLGYRDIETRELTLETPFFLVTASAPARS
jgi:SAM-dependent methyltransferase